MQIDPESMDTKASFGVSEFFLMGLLLHTDTIPEHAGEGQTENL